MKKQNKKLKLNKETISRLNYNEQNNLIGGVKSTKPCVVDPFGDTGSKDISNPNDPWGPDPQAGATEICGFSGRQSCPNFVGPIGPTGC